uniref:hypothetical protein n=1 Tax=Prevotella sp. TaxID=59823 RepID=UPI004026C5C4
MAELVVKKWQLGRALTAKKHGKSRFLRIQTHISRIRTHVLRIQTHCLFFNKVDTLKSTIMKKKEEQL